MTDPDTKKPTTPPGMKPEPKPVAVRFQSPLMLPNGTHRVSTKLNDGGPVVTEMDWHRAGVTFVHEKKRIVVPFAQCGSIEVE